MDPHYFGESNHQLFGIYHPPKGVERHHGILLCPPGPQEYMWSHMAFRKLAALLAREGFHVLRFDYYGTGDSGGDCEASSIAEWRANLVDAVADLKECSGVTKVSVVGLRLGAALAALAPLTASNLVLWEPVVDGKLYIDELRATHERTFSALLFPPTIPACHCGGDLLGFAFPPALEAEIDDINLVAGVRSRSDHIALVISDERPEYAQLRERLQQDAAAGGPSFEYYHVPDESYSQHRDAMLLSTQVLQAMTSVLARRTR
jgi:pimeloyl-ACP methyl ester carboxylesterase